MIRSFINKLSNISNVFASIAASVIGLFLGFLVLLVSNPSNALNGFGALLTGAVSKGFAGFGNVITYAAIFILCGLSVGFAGKTGVFNIGGSGQFIVGGVTAIYIGIFWTWLPIGLHCLVAVLAGTITGALWGSIIGLLRALFNISEIVVGILLNYVALHLVNMVVFAFFYNSYANRSQVVESTALVPRFGLDRIFPDTGADAAIFVAILMAVLIYIILNKTTFGYEIRTVGFNKDAGTYSGINAKKNTVFSMAIAGALPGMAGALFYLSSTYNYWTVADALPAQPTVGICASLIALGNPIGTIFSSLFLAYITVSGLNIQLHGFAPEIVSVVTSAIIYCCAFVMLINRAFKNFSKKITKTSEETIL